MVFEGELDSACTETRSSYTESELENIKAKNMEVDRILNFVPVPQSPSLTAFIENQLSKSEKFSEQEMDSLLQQNLKLDTKLGSDSESLEIFPVPESDTFTSYLENQFSKIDNLSEQDLDSMVEQNLELDSAFKKDSQSNFSFPDADLSYEGTLTDMSEGFSVDDVDPAQDDEFVSTASKLPLENKPQQHMGSSNTVCSPFALSIPPALAA